MRAATVEVMAWERVASRKKYCLAKRAMPMGTRAIPMTRMSLSREFIISDWPGPASFLASSVRREA